MSQAIRDALAAAARAVPAVVSAHSYYSAGAVTTPGSVFVRLDRIEYPNEFGGVGHYNVVVTLPQDQADAEKFIDSKVPAIREAVAEALHVTRVQPQRMDFPGVGVLPVVFINGHREEE